MGVYMHGWMYLSPSVTMCWCVQDKISYEGFTDFMVHQLGDVDTKDAIIESFLALTKGKDSCDVRGSTNNRTRSHPFACSPVH